MPGLRCPVGDRMDFSLGSDGFSQALTRVEISTCKHLVTALWRLYHSLFPHHRALALILILSQLVTGPPRLMLAPKSRVLQNLGHFLVQHRRLFCKIGSKSRQYMDARSANFCRWLHGPRCPVLQIYAAGGTRRDPPVAIGLCGKLHPA
jgi:hypothetical protein